MKRVFAKFTSLNSRIALRVARKIAPCDMAFTSQVISRVFICAFTLCSLDIAGVFQGKLQAGLSSSAETAAARKTFLVRIAS